MEKDGFDIEFMQIVTQIVLDTVKVTALAKFGKNDEDRKSVFFLRNVLLNAVGNTVLECTNYDVEDSLDRNIKATIADLQQWFNTVKKAKANRSQKDTH